MSNQGVLFKRLFYWPKVKLVSLLAACKYYEAKNGSDVNVNQLHNYMEELVRKRRLLEEKRAPSVQRVYDVANDLIEENMFAVTKEMSIGGGRTIRFFKPTEDALKISRWIGGKPEVSGEIFVMSLWESTWKATIGRLKQSDQKVKEFVAKWKEYKNDIDMIVLANISGWGLANFLSDKMQKEIYPFVPALADLYDLKLPEKPSIRGKRVALVDYNILTGGTMRKAKETIAKLGGIPVVGIVAFYLPALVKQDIGLPIVTLLEAPWPFAALQPISSGTSEASRKAE